MMEHYISSLVYCCHSVVILLFNTTVWVQRFHSRSRPGSSSNSKVELLHASCGSQDLHSPTILHFILLVHIHVILLYSSGWWLLLTPLKNDGVRQLGLLYSSQYIKKTNVPNHVMFDNYSTIFHGQPVMTLLWPVPWDPKRPRRAGWPGQRTWPGPQRTSSSDRNVMDGLGKPSMLSM